MSSTYPIVLKAMIAVAMAVMAAQSGMAATTKRQAAPTVGTITPFHAVSTNQNFVGWFSFAAALSKSRRIVFMPHSNPRPTPSFCASRPFLANVVMANGMTIGQAIMPRLTEAAETGRLLPAAGETT